MSEQFRPVAAFDDAELELALRASSVSIVWPTASPAGAPDVATRVRARLVACEAARRGSWRLWRPARRGLVLAIAALLALAAIAGAVGLGLPGLRIILGEPPVSPPPSVAAPSGLGPSGLPSRTPPSGAPGSTLRLGDAVSLDDVEALTGIPPTLPIDPAIGPPDAVYVDRSRSNQVALVWAPSAALPETRDPGVGLILMRFDGRTDEGYHQKLIGLGVTSEPVTVAGRSGFWISGDPHFFFYVREDGATIDDDRRWVGDALVWSDGTVTYRIEGALGRDATIDLAESLR
jgi:hypothetical protein